MFWIVFLYEFDVWVGWQCIEVCVLVCDMCWIGYELYWWWDCVECCVCVYWCVYQICLVIELCGLCGSCFVIEYCVDVIDCFYQLM